MPIRGQNSSISCALLSQNERRPSPAKGILWFPAQSAHSAEVLYNLHDTLSVLDRAYEVIQTNSCLKMDGIAWERSWYLQSTLIILQTC